MLGSLVLLTLSLAAPSDGYVLHVGKLVTCDDQDTIHAPGTIIVRDGRIVAVGGDLEVPDDLEVLEYPSAWAVPGMVDLHTHIHTGGWGDINDMVRTINCDLRSGGTFRPHNASIKRACASGVTTLFGIPGSGTSISGFGILYKAKTRGTYDDSVVADPGGMKVAQSHNPERSGGDLGRTRAGLGWALEDISRRAIEATREGRRDWQLENLMKVHTGELPVLMHCAGSDGVGNAARMWGETYPDVRSIISHGSFDGWHMAEYVARVEMPVNHGPRVMNYEYGIQEERIVGTAHEFVEAGVPLFSLNTDSPVVAQEELFLQGSMSAWLGADPYLMLRAVTIHPAKAFGIDDRLGSLEPGKDADIVVRTGDPLDPRAAVELVLIDGEVHYDRSSDGQWF